MNIYTANFDSSSSAGTNHILLWTSCDLFKTSLLLADIWRNHKQADKNGEKALENNLSFGSTSCVDICCSATLKPWITVIILQCDVLLGNPGYWHSYGCSLTPKAHPDSVLDKPCHGSSRIIALGHTTCMTWAVINSPKGLTRTPKSPAHLATGLKGSFANIHHRYSCLCLDWWGLHGLSFLYFPLFNQSEFAMRNLEAVLHFLLVMFLE